MSTYSEKVAANPSEAFGGTELAAKLDTDFANTSFKDSDTLLTENTKVNNICYKHPRGDSEYVGDSTYGTNGVGIYLGPQCKKLLVKRIKCKIYGTAATVVDVEIRKGTTRNNNPSTHTLVESIPFLAGEFNTEEDSFLELTLTNDLVLEADEYLYVFAKPTVGTATLKRWLTDESDPARNYIIFNLGTDTWYFGGTGYYAVPLLVFSDVADNEDLLQEIETFNDSLTSEVAILNASIDLKQDIRDSYLTIPKVINAVVGIELNLWFDSLILAPDRGLASPLYYNVEIIGDVGKLYERCYRITAITGDIGEHSLTVNVYDCEKKLIETKAITLNIIANTAPTSINNILMVGDSLTYQGVITETIQSHFNDLGSNIPLFWGRAGTSPANQEGVSGASFDYFAIAGSNPFWIGDKLDIAAYRATLSMIGTFDLVTIQLGVNDCFGGAERTDGQVANWLNNAKILMNAFLEDNANTKFIIMLTSTDCNTKGGLAVNYGALYGKELYQKSIFKLRKAMLAEFDEDAYSANVKIGIAGLCCDRYYGYQRASSVISSRTSETLEKHINALHPAESGYQQMGDAIYSQMQTLI